MKKISFNEGTLGFEKNKVTYEVPLEKTNIQSIEEIKFIENIPFMFPIKHLGLTENKTFLFMEFEVEKGFLPLGTFKSNSTEKEKYEFIKNLCSVAMKLGDLEKLVTVLDDRNILINPKNQDVKFLYRGVKGIMPSALYDKEDIETQVKRLAMYILTTAKFDEIRVNGLDIAVKKVSSDRYKTVSKILNSSTLNELVEFMDDLQDQQELETQIIEEPKKSIFSMIPTSVVNGVDKINKSIIYKKASPEKVINKSRQFTKKKLDNVPRIKLVLGIILGGILILFVLAFFNPGKVPNHNVGFANSQSDEEIIVKALQYAAIQDYKGAADNFARIKTPFNKLSQENQRAMLFSYLMTGRYQKALDVEPKFSYSLINYLVSKNDIGAIKNINSKEPVIIFEKAAIKNDYKTVLKYKDIVDLDGRRESLVVDAYIALNKLDEGIKFAQAKGNQNLLDKLEVLKNKKSQDPNYQEVKGNDPNVGFKTT